MEKIFKYFTLDQPITTAYITWFTKNFPETEFTGIDKVLYLYLKYCADLGIVAKRKYLLVFLSTDLKKLVRKYNIRVDSLTANFNYDEIAAFEQAVQVISSATIDAYDAWCSTPVNEEDNFKVLLSEFMSVNMKERISNVFMEQFTKMNSGEDTIDIAEGTQIAMNTIREIYDTSKLSKLDFLTGKKDSSGRDASKKARLISKTGIPAIDEDYGGVFSKALITFAGQTGGGKTRFMCAVFIYPALVQYKVGVRMDELELEDYEIENILLSIHIAKLYKVKIPDRDINRDDLTDEQRKIVESARIDLFESGKYGRFVLSTDDMIVETMYDEAMNYFKLNRDIQIWAIDYIGRIRSKPSNRYEIKSLAEVINSSLLFAKDVARHADIAVVCANQYNEEGNKSAFAGKPITVGMIQGGQAVQRHSDYDIAMTFTADQKVANLRMISTTKERAAVGYQFVPLQVDLAISRWTQINQIEERG